MKLKIHNTEVIIYRIPGELYYKALKRADLKKMNINDYAKNVFIKHMEFKEDKHK